MSLGSVSLKKGLLPSARRIEFEKHNADFENGKSKPTQGR